MKEKKEKGNGEKQKRSNMETYLFLLFFSSVIHYRSFTFDGQHESLTFMTRTRITILVTLFWILAYVLCMFFYIRFTIQHALTLAQVCFVGLSCFVLFLFLSTSSASSVGTSATAVRARAALKKIQTVLPRDKAKTDDTEDNEDDDGNEQEEDEEDEEEYEPDCESRDHDAQSDSDPESYDHNSPQKDRNSGGGRHHHKTIPDLERAIRGPPKCPTPPPAGVSGPMESMFQSLLRDNSVYST